MSNPLIGYTFAIATRNPKNTFVFCKWLKDLKGAIMYAKQQIADRAHYDVEFIVIREGTVSAEDPVVWDSRTPEPVVVYQEDLLEADMQRAMAEIPYPDPGLMIWHHTPLPPGFPIEKVHARFEERAASVLSDYEEPTNFERDPGYPDGRYKDITVRTAWMMYLDLALEHYDRFGTIV